MNNSCYYGVGKKWGGESLTLAKKRSWLRSASDEELLSQYRTVIITQYVEERKRGGFLDLLDDVEMARDEILVRLKSKRQ